MDCPVPSFDEIKFNPACQGENVMCTFTYQEAVACGNALWEMYRQFEPRDIPIPEDLKKLHQALFMRFANLALSIEEMVRVEKKENHHE